MKIGIVSDIHEDIIRLKEALIFFEKQKCDKLVCLGDIVGFSAPFYGYFTTRSASKCIELIRSNFDVVVAGNHDLHSIKKLPEFNADVLYPSDFYDLDYHNQIMLFENVIWNYDKNSLNPLLTSSDADFLSGLNEFEILDTGNDKILFSHYIYPNVSGSKIEFYRESADFKQHFEFMERQKCNISISGHTHEEGAVVFDNQSVKFNSFGRFKLKNDKIKSIIGPGIANGTSANGFSIYDSNKKELRTIPLKSKRYRYPDCFKTDKNILQK
ncbi:MAG: metallophosphoesterase [Bacteroidales bacterium]|nr:metallophosphoesterase [Bacteroidales bacterium]